MALNESDLLRLLHSTEHSFVERKTVSDGRDWVKSVVAFANTLPSDQEGILFVGATDAGEIEPHSSNLDKLQKSFSEKLQNAYPPVYYTTRIVQESGRECLAVIVPGSSLRPHFAGQAFIRDGSKSVEATSEQYETLLASRTGKAYEIQKMMETPLTVSIFQRQAGVAYVINRAISEARISKVNQFYVTIDFGNRKQSYPLSRVEISFDDGMKRPQLEISELATTY
jgi:predicted HTH transcriptional regulator